MASVLALIGSYFTSYKIYSLIIVIRINESSENIQHPNYSISVGFCRKFYSCRVNKRRVCIPHTVDEQRDRRKLQPKSQPGTARAPEVCTEAIRMVKVGESLGRNHTNYFCLYDLTPPRYTTPLRLFHELETDRLAFTKLLCPHSVDTGRSSEEESKWRRILLSLLFPTTGFELYASLH